MNLTPTRIKCLRAIHDGRGEVCLKGYRFDSAAYLEQAGMIHGDRNQPYWTWTLTSEGRWLLNLQPPRAS